MRGILVALAIAGCSRSTPAVTHDSSPAAAAVPAKDPATARRLMASGAVVLDVRSADEYADDHLATAVNVPVQELPARLSEVDRLVSGDRTRPIVVYCSKGGRAAKAKAELEAAGYSQVVNGGGLADLR
ncbi:MAG TPA: rhodanese-like domain-containing protein [Kofleriaceae bacterium]|nr:rhodanese-like domain-containing protein [Kofleriaceae bacterium]